MSALVDQAVSAAGLADVAAARRTGSVDAAGAARLRSADLLVLGALADRARRDEVGDRVRIYAPPPQETDEQVIAFPSGDHEWTGLELLREIAMARLTAARGARIRVDFTRAGLELAQVALGFGASELAGHLATKAGLPIIDGALAGVGKKSRLEPARLVKTRELAGFVRRAGRVPVYVEKDGTELVEDPNDGG